MKLSLKLMSLLLCANVFICCSGCNKNSHETLEDSTVVISDCEDIVRSGNYVYYNYNGVVSRYNLYNGEFSSACMSPICSHYYIDQCPMWDVEYFAFVANHSLYYTRFNMLTDNYRSIMSYNLLDGTTKVLKQYSKEESDAALPKTDGTYIYYSCKKLIENGSAETPENYQLYLFRQSLEGGEEQLLFAMEETDRLIFVTDNRFLFLRNSCEIYMTDTTGNQLTLLFSREECKSITKLQLLDNRLYFLATDGYYEVAAHGGKVFFQNLLCLDLESGETVKVLDDYVVHYTIDDEQIYYLLYDLKTLPLSNSKDPGVYVPDYTWRSCDINGDHIKALFTHDNILYTDSCRVIDGMLYSTIKYYDEKKETKSDGIFVAVNVQNGSITEIGNISSTLHPEE